MVALFSHASGIIISTACGRVRPPRCSSSSTSSNEAESDAPGVQIGNALARSPGISLDAQHRLAGAHPVPVAADGVDLAVVRDVAERVGQRPGRERVGGEPGVHDGDRADRPLVGDVGEERRQLLGGQHALVDDGAAGQRGEVDAVPPAACDRSGVVLDPLAGRVDRSGPGRRRRAACRPAPAGPARNSCSNAGITSSAIRPTPEPTGSVGTGRQPSSSRPSSAMMPATISLASARSFSGSAAGTPARRRTPGRAAGRADRQREVRDLAERSSGTWIRIPAPSPTAGSAPAAPRWSRLISAVTAVVHDRVAASALDIGHRRDTAGVTLELWVVQPLGGGCCRVLHGRPPVVGGVTALRRRARWTCHIGYAGTAVSR